MGKDKSGENSGTGTQSNSQVDAISPNNKNAKVDQPKFEIEKNIGFSEEVLKWNEQTLTKEDNDVAQMIKIMDRDEPVFEEIEMGDQEYSDISKIELKDNANQAEDTYYGQPLESFDVQNQVGNKSENVQEKNQPLASNDSKQEPPLNISRGSIFKQTPCKNNH